MTEIFVIIKLENMLLKFIKIKLQEKCIEKQNVSLQTSSNECAPLQRNGLSGNKNPNVFLIYKVVALC